MRFLTDENISMPAIRRLREDGLHVTSILEDAPGSTDVDVIAHARRADAILISFDSDIGTQIFANRVTPPLGVLYLRFVDAYPEEAADVLQHILSMPDIELEGRFTTYRNGTIRQRPLANER